MARESIRHGLEVGRPMEVVLSRCVVCLREPGASFVTLKRDGSLRGCVGTLQARRALVEDVALNAFAAAFRDSRFPPLSSPELAGLDVHISLLTVPEALPVNDETDLLEKLCPGRDGLVLEDPPFRSTFLPQVWEMLPEPAEFLKQLRLKAGLPADHWSSTLRFSRYQVEEI